MLFVILFILLINFKVAPRGEIVWFHQARFDFTSNNTIPHTSAIAPTAGEIKWLAVVSKCIPRKSIGLPGVVKLMPEYASTTRPRTTRMMASVFVFILQIKIDFRD
jgi:hypothetical protein